MFLHFFFLFSFLIRLCFFMENTTELQLNTYNSLTLNNTNKSNCLKCGTKNSLNNTNLNTTKQALFGEFPWMLGVFTNNSFRFGASLIHPKMAMTVAHHVSVFDVYTVRAGEWNWDNINEPFAHEDRLTEKVIIHPSYKRNILINDIALLVLRSPFTILPHIGTICLPNPSIAYDPTNCVVTGWGKDSNGKFQKILRQIKLSILSNEDCKRQLQSTRLGIRFHVHQSYMCVKGQGFEATNFGDGGGPFICSGVDDSSVYQQVGIVSWSIYKRTVDNPNVFMNVTLFIDWILSAMNRNGLRNCIQK